MVMPFCLSFIAISDFARTTKVILKDFNPYINSSCSLQFERIYAQKNYRIMRFFSNLLCIFVLFITLVIKTRF